MYDMCKTQSCCTHMSYASCMSHITYTITYQHILSVTYIAEQVHLSVVTRMFTTKKNMNSKSHKLYVTQAVYVNRELNTLARVVVITSP